MSGPLGPRRPEFLVTTAAVTRNVNRRGPSWLQFLVTTAAVTRNVNRLGPSWQQFLATLAALTGNVSVWCNGGRGGIIHFLLSYSLFIGGLWAGSGACLTETFISRRGSLSAPSFDSACVSKSDT